MNERILIVEDDRALAEIMMDFFTDRDYIVSSAFNGMEAMTKAEKETFDIILLDINLPDMDGFEVCRYFREYYHIAAPVLFITARASEIDKLKGYASGGDDYITKPFSLLVLNAKIKAILARTNKKEEIQRYGSLSINMDGRSVRIGEEEIQLAPKEFELLAFLAENSGKLFSREALRARLWTDESEGSDRAVDDHIRKLRKALGDKAEYIQTIRGGGYRFIIPKADSEV